MPLRDALAAALESTWQRRTDRYRVEDFGRDAALILAEPAFREALVGAVVEGQHAWLCGSRKHGDKGRPHIGWACERGARAIVARMLSTGSEGAGGGG